jgi:uncharacterized protein (DUF2062 family)
MMFGRKEKPPLSERVRVALWPRRSWSRSMRYVMQRVRRLTAEPHAVALGFACGVFASFLPFMGFHFLLAGLLAFALRGSILASAFGTAVGNPVTFPLIWFASLKLGRWIQGHGGADLSAEEVSSEVMDGPVERLAPLLEPMTIGGAPLGLIAGLVSYVLVRRAVAAYQDRRRLRLLRGAGGAPAIPGPIL